MIADFPGFTWWQENVDFRIQFEGWVATQQKHNAGQWKTLPFGHWFWFCWQVWIFGASKKDKISWHNLHREAFLNFRSTCRIKTEQTVSVDNLEKFGMVKTHCTIAKEEFTERWMYNLPEPWIGAKEADLRSSYRWYSDWTLTQQQQKNKNQSPSLECSCH